MFLTTALGRLTLPPTTTPWRTAGGWKGQWLAEVALLAGEGGAEGAGELLQGWRLQIGEAVLYPFLISCARKDQITRGGKRP